MDFLENAAGPGLLTAIAAIFALAGLVKGVVGLGLPTVSMALLALLMPPAEAAALLIAPSLLTNVWQMRPWTTLLPMLSRLWRMQLGACVGTLAASAWLGAPAGAWAVLSLGLALMIYAGLGLAELRFSVRRKDEHWLAPLVGLLTGAVTAATGVFVIPAVPYLQALGLRRDELLQAMGISFTFSTLALALGLYLQARYLGAIAGVSMLALLPAVAGMALGQLLRERIAPAAFRRLFFVCLLLLGAHMCVRELMRY
jgi:uncharacterized membrane protein YfcA